MDTHIATAQKVDIPLRQQPLLYHDLLSPSEVQHIREEVRNFSDTVVAPRSWDIGHGEESIDHFPRDVFKRMAEAGLFHIPFKADVSSQGLLIGPQPLPLSSKSSPITATALRRSMTCIAFFLAMRWNMRHRSCRPSICNPF